MTNLPSAPLTWKEKLGIVGVSLTISVVFLELLLLSTLVFIWLFGLPKIGE